MGDVKVYPNGPAGHSKKVCRTKTVLLLLSPMADFQVFIGWEFLFRGIMLYISWDGAIHSDPANWIPVAVLQCMAHQNRPRSNPRWSWSACTKAHWQTAQLFHGKFSLQFYKHLVQAWHGTHLENWLSCRKKRNVLILFQILTFHYLLCVLSLNSHI